LLKQFRTPFAPRSALQAEDVFGRLVHMQLLLHIFHPSDSLDAANEVVELASEYMALEQDLAIPRSHLDSVRMTHESAQPRPNPFNKYLIVGLVLSKNCPNCIARTSGSVCGISLGFID
jgi:hypothetical protein